MGASEAVVWREFFALEPWPEQRADLRAGIIAATVANANRVKGRPLTPRDFMPRFGEEPRRQTAKEQYQIMRMWVAATGGQVVKRGEC